MHVDRGNEKLRQGFYEEARDHFREALTLDPQNEGAHVGLATAQIALNDLSGARSELEVALRSKPSSDLYATLGQLDLKENKLEAANEDVSQALTLGPDNALALELKRQLVLKLAAASRTRQ
jgi:Tfp pilus assembly protein PilF